MSAKPTAAELHAAHEDERNRLHALAKHEQAIRERERHREHLRVVTALVQECATREFRTPIVHPYDHNAVVGHMLAPGDIDDTGFSDGIA
jgi:hypothetical protein